MIYRGSLYITLFVFAASLARAGTDCPAGDPTCVNSSATTGITLQQKKPPPPGMSAAVASVGASEAAAAAKEVSGMDNSTEITQDGAHLLIKKVQTTSRDRTSGLGALACAKGFIKIVTDPLLAAGLFSSCKKSINTSYIMDDLGDKAAGYAAKSGGGTDAYKTKSESMMTSIRDDEGVFGDLAAKYDVQKGEFVESVMRHRGDAEKVGDHLFADKIPKGSVANAMQAFKDLSDEARQKLLADNNLQEGDVAATAEEESPKQSDQEFTYSQGGAKKAPIVTKESLRDKLKKSLAERALEAQQRSLASREKGAPAIGNEKLVPEKDKLLEDAEAQQAPVREVSLFDVVHAKYAEKFQHLEKTR